MLQICERVCGWHAAVLQLFSAPVSHEGSHQHAGQGSGSSYSKLSYLGVAAAIKLMTAVPELIWAAVEAGQFTLGAQLFLLAQHVHTGLLADAGGQVTAEKIAQWFPVIARQWATI